MFMAYQWTRDILFTSSGLFVCGTDFAVVGHGYLAVPDTGVAVGVGCENTAQCCNAHLILKGSVLWHGAVQVPLNLVRSQRGPAQCLLHQLSIVARVGGQLILGSWTRVVRGQRLEMAVIPVPW